MAVDPARAFDERLVPLDWDEDDPMRAAFELTPHLLRMDGMLFGGTAVSASLIAMERVTERAPVWVTVQFVASATLGDRIDLEVTIAAAGRSVEQVQVQGRCHGRLVFSALGATATRNPEGITGIGAPPPPAVLPPDECPLWTGHDAGAPVGHHLVSEFREAFFVTPEPERPGHMALWGRVFESPLTTPAKLGFLADMVPLAIDRGAGVPGAGTSLDNTLRIGRLVDSEWVLIELDGHVAEGGLGHGGAHLWSPEGVLLASASQTAKLFSFEQLAARRA